MEGVLFVAGSIAVLGGLAALVEAAGPRRGRPGRKQEGPPLGRSLMTRCKPLAFNLAVKT